MTPALPRPPELERVEIVYAVAVIGDAMVPLAEEGDRVYCCPVARLSEIPGGTVVHVVLTDQSQWVRQLFHVADGVVELRPANAKFPQRTVTRAEIQSVSVAAGFFRHWPQPR
jgi:hypothetical protein